MKPWKGLESDEKGAVDGEGALLNRVVMEGFSEQRTEWSEVGSHLRIYGKSILGSGKVIAMDVTWEQVWHAWGQQNREPGAEPATGTVADDARKVARAQIMASWEST